MGLLIEGIGVSLVSMLVVFLGLIILIFCISILAKTFKEKPKEAPEKSHLTNVIVEKQDDSILKDENNLKLIAAIISAVSMCMEPNARFTVKRIKRANKIN